MIKRHPLPENIDMRLRSLAQSLGGRRDVAFAYLFGGLARGAKSAMSDVDIAVYLDPSAPHAETTIDLIGLVGDMIGTDEFDLVILNRAPVSLAGRILNHRQVLADNVPFVRHRYESLVRREFFDFSRKEAAILEQRFF